MRGKKRKDHSGCECPFCNPGGGGKPHTLSRVELEHRRREVIEESNVRDPAERAAAEMNLMTGCHRLEAVTLTYIDGELRVRCPVCGTLAFAILAAPHLPDAKPAPVVPLATVKP